jgi:hypothetical protein
MMNARGHMSSVRYLHRWQVDDERWNQAVSSSGFSMVYAQSWYLDACADYWAALVLEDYDFVMPVAYRRKLGFKYLYQPRFCQQLGIYSEKQVDAQIVTAFLNTLRKHFWLGDYAFNEGNLLEASRTLQVTENVNFVLGMKAEYETLSKAYSENCRRNIKKAMQSGLKFSGDVSISELVLLKEKHDHSPQTHKHYQSLAEMFSGMLEAGRVQAYGMKLGQELCAGAIFASGHIRIHYLLSVSTSTGKENSAMFGLIDRVIQRHAGQDLDLDFEGSNLEHLARFFRGFGAQAQRYQRIRFNNAAGRFVQKVRSVRPR